MADSTGITWTDATWNPIVGCSIVSPGCTNCYAMQQAERIIRMNKGKPSHYDGTIKVVNGNPVWTGVLTKAPDHIFTQPLRWKKPRRIFVNSMSDLFHESVPDELIDEVFAIMALSSQHTFQVLTKRSKRMREYMAALTDDTLKWRVLDDIRMAKAIGSVIGGMTNWRSDDPRAESSLIHIDPTLGNWPMRNIWLGVSAEDQVRADERIPDLLATPAAKRFVSAEPLLRRIDFRWALSRNRIEIGAGFLQRGHFAPGLETLSPLDWIIVGGESGPNHRVMDVAAVSSIRLQCEEAGVPFFFKQDSGPKPGMQGRATDALWARKEFPS